MNVTKEQLDAWEKEIERQEQFLLSHGWHLGTRDASRYDGQDYKEECWIDPIGNYHPYQRGYDQLTMILLKEKGWKSIVETRHLGKKEWNKADKWGRYQSPATRRVYTFLDAQFVMEQGFDENLCPLELCCGSTKMLNDLIGKNFDGDVIETWLYRSEKDELVLQWWNG